MMTPRERELIAVALHFYSEAMRTVKNTHAFWPVHADAIKRIDECTTLAHRIESGQFEATEDTPRGYDSVPLIPLSEWKP